jgi:hypothetical protein
VRSAPFESTPSSAHPTNLLPTQRNQAETGLLELAKTASDQTEIVTRETRDSHTQASRQTRAPRGESRGALMARIATAALPDSVSSIRGVVGSLAKFGTNRISRIPADPTKATGAQSNTVKQTSTELKSNTEPASLGAPQGSRSPTHHRPSPPTPGAVG